MKIVSIEEDGFEELRCITLADQRGLYVTDDMIITHNSTFTMLSLLYVACCFGLMRDPWKFFSMAKSSVFVFALCAVTSQKASEIYREPIQQLIESSEYWHWCRTHGEMLAEDKHLRESDHVDYIPWTTATSSSQPLDCKVYLPDGSYKLMGDIEVGDIIASPTTGATEVTAIPFFGEDVDEYEIELEDGRKTRCGPDHLWRVSYRKDEDGNKIFENVYTTFLFEHPEIEFDIIEDTDLTN